MADFMLASVIANLFKKVSAEVVLEAFVKGAAGQAGKMAAEQVIAMISDLSNNSSCLAPVILTDQEKAAIQQLIPYMSTSLWNIFIANLKLVHNNNILLLGPTGAGKSRLYKFLGKDSLVSNESTDKDASTGKAEKKKAQGHRQYLYYIDTPGSRTHSDIERYAYSEVASGSKTVVAIVLAGGRLENADLGGYYLPGAAQRERFTSLSQYIEASLVYERNYLADLEGWLAKNPLPERRVSYFMIILNKMDIWLDNYQNTLDYYQGELQSDQPASSSVGVSAKYTAKQSKEIYHKLTSICGHICKAGVSPTFHVVASAYDAFPRKSEQIKDQREHPSGKLNQELTKISRLLLQAEFRSRIHIG